MFDRISINISHIHRSFVRNLHNRNSSLDGSLGDCLKSAEIIAIIKSKVDYFDKRKFIRWDEDIKNTLWILLFRGSWGTNLPCLFFVLGLSKHKSVNDKVEKEIEEENDILLYPELDSYSNLTYKVFNE